MSVANLRSPTYACAVSTTAVTFPVNQTEILYITVKNPSTVPVFVTSGDASTAAVFPTESATPTGNSGKVFLPNEVSTYHKRPMDTHISVIAQSGTGTVYIEAGNGV